MSGVVSPYYFELTYDMRKIVDDIEPILQKIHFPKRSSIYNFKKSTGYGLSEAFGFIRKRNRCPGPSINNTKYPELWDKLKQLGALLPISYDAVQVNLNCICAPHRDLGNHGLSFLVSGGNYTGGELVTELGTFDAKYKGLIFDGSQITHSNLPMVGSKYTLVFFSIVIPNCKKHFFTNDFKRQDYKKRKTYNRK